MKKTAVLLIISIISIMAAAQTKITLTVEEASMTATLVDNEATRRLLDLLAEGPIQVSMSDYGGFEKVGSLPQSLPTSNSQITTSPGDIMLYQGNQIVIFYGSNSWSYTPLGKIDGATSNNLRQFLGTGTITLTLTGSLAVNINEIQTDGDNSTTLDSKPSGIYDLQGHRLNADSISDTDLQSGLYIVNGKKHFRPKRR